MNLGMTGKRSWLHTIPLHPLFFAAYPILALLSFNVTELNFTAGLRSLLLSTLLGGVLFLIFRRIYHDSNQGALVSSAVLILFYSYGHSYNLLVGINVAGLHPFQHLTLGPFWLVLAALIIWWVSRRAGHISTATYGLNVMGLILLALPVFQLTSFFVERKLSDANAGNDSTTLSLKPGNQPPDIYYIILDGYGRSDVMKGYGYDNSVFLNTLRESGFFVADCAQSNYAQTKLSLASSLNFNYLEALGEQFVAGSNDRTGLNTLIHYSAVRKNLEKAGYKTIAFATGYPMTELNDADHYLAPRPTWRRLNEFEVLLLKTTLAGSIERGSIDIPDLTPEISRERTLFALEQLETIPGIPGPKFVFVHVVSPHPPYVFGPTGGPIAPAQEGLTRAEQSGLYYRDQAMYISSRIMEIVPGIIANSTTPPVIVIQGDHGPTLPSHPRERMGILNAYFLPGVDANMYSTITPVNTFRVIFNVYFGQNLEYLDDTSLYSSYRRPFNYRVISNSCKTND